MHHYNLRQGEQTDPSVSFYGLEAGSSSTDAAGQTMRTALAKHLLPFIILLGILSQSVCFSSGCLCEGEKFRARMEKVRFFSKPACSDHLQR